MSPATLPANAGTAPNLGDAPDARAPRRYTARTYFFIMAMISLVSIIGTTILAISQPSLAVTPDPATNGAVMVTFQVLSFFTVLSNILVLVTGFMLARDPNRSGRIFRVIHFDALIMITVTGIVYAVILAPLAHPVGLNVYFNAGLHYIAPPMFVLGWALFGPRPTFSFKLLGQSLIIPGLWVTYTLIHGAIIGWYPYPFLNVEKLGYGTVGINLVVITMAAMLIGAMYLGFGSMAARIKTRRDVKPLGQDETATPVADDAAIVNLQDSQENATRELIAR